MCIEKNKGHCTMEGDSIVKLSTSSVAFVEGNQASFFFFVLFCFVLLCTLCCDTEIDSFCILLKIEIYTHIYSIISLSHYLSSLPSLDLLISLSGISP